MIASENMTGGMVELDRFIRGELTPHLGQGMWTYPAAVDVQEKAKHADCLRLEAIGRIYRASDLPDRTFWMPVLIEPRNPTRQHGKAYAGSNPVSGTTVLTT